MRRSSVFLSRRLSRRLPRQRRHVRYHYSHTQKRANGANTHRRKRQTKRSLRYRGGSIGETKKELYGIPIMNRAWITNGKGKTQSVSEIEPALERSDTQGLPGDDDV